MIFIAFPLDITTTALEVKVLYQKVEDLVQKHLATVTTPQMAPEVSASNSMIGFAVSIIRTLTDLQNFFIDPFVSALIRVLQRLGRDMGSCLGSQVRQVRR